MSWYSINSTPVYQRGQRVNIIYIGPNTNVAWHCTSRDHKMLSNALVWIGLAIAKIQPSQCLCTNHTFGARAIRDGFYGHDGQTKITLLLYRPIMTSSNGNICAGNSPVHGEFPAQRPVTRSFDAFFDMRPNKRLSKQSWGWWFGTPSRSLWRHRNANNKLGLMWNDPAQLWRYNV